MSSPSWRHGWARPRDSGTFWSHLYLAIDDRQVFASLGHLDDLRAFAAIVQRLADEH